MGRASADGRCGLLHERERLRARRPARAHAHHGHEAHRGRDADGRRPPDAEAPERFEERLERADLEPPFLRGEQRLIEDEERAGRGPGDRGQMHSGQPTARLLSPP